MDAHQVQLILASIKAQDKLIQTARGAKSEEQGHVAVALLSCQQRVSVRSSSLFSGMI